MLEAGMSPKDIAQQLGPLRKPKVAEAVGVVVTQQEIEMGAPRINEKTREVIRGLAKQRLNTREIKEQLKLMSQTDPEIEARAGQSGIWRYWREGRDEAGMGPMHVDARPLRPRKDSPPPKPAPNGSERPKVDLKLVAATIKRDDRRIIFAKLNELYIDEHKGYCEGWTDQRVAEDLGVPRAWVEALREENFGPVKSNTETSEFLHEAEKVLSQAKQLADNVEKALSNLKFQIEFLEKKALAIQKAVGA